MPKHAPALTPPLIARYAHYLREQERSSATIQKYTRDLAALLEWLDRRPLTKEALVEWKESLTLTHAPASVNSMLAAANGYLSFWGWTALRLRPLKLQRALFLEDHKELTRTEYARLVNTAERMGNQRLALMLQTICSTGIRVSELRFITAEAVQTGRSMICNKGKRRTVLLPDKLRFLLKNYLQNEKITAGAVFVSRSGKPLDRSNIWREMKILCSSAGVDASKVFPHNLRHLFARTYYAQEKDLFHLADILGHSSVNTTRIYTAESISIHARQMEQLELIIT